MLSVAKQIEQNAPFITTFLGRHFHFLNPAPDEIEIKDIAAALAIQCRFNGHIPFLSVAEHSVAVASRLPARLQLAGLLHDAAEAYLSDIPSPIKQYLPDYEKLETIVDKAIDLKFGIELSLEDKVELKKADLEQTYTEAHYLLAGRGQGWVPILWQPDPKMKPRCLAPAEAMDMFMHWFSSLTDSSLANELVIVPG